MNEKIFDGIRDALMEILDVGEADINPDSYLIRELGAESIDLLELAVTIGSRFHMAVDDQAIFLLSLRRLLVEAEDRGKAPAAYLTEAIPFLDGKRIAAILDDLDQGPVLRVSDLVDYIRWRQEAVS